jgi:hypothetical protein
MNRAWIAVTCLLACLFLSSGVVAQQPSDGLVRVPVTVMDQDGRPAANLQSKDFVVFENGVAREIRTFAQGDNQGAYVISYVPAQNPSADYRSIVVQVSRANVRVRARAGYFPPASK